MDQLDYTEMTIHFNRITTRLYHDSNKNVGYTVSVDYQEIKKQPINTYRYNISKLLNRLEWLIEQNKNYSEHHHYYCYYYYHHHYCFIMVRWLAHKIPGAYCLYFPVNLICQHCLWCPVCSSHTVIKWKKSPHISIKYLRNGWREVHTISSLF